MTKQEMIIAAIEAIGYKPQVDDNGNVIIYYQMKAIYFVVGQEDERYLAVVLPEFSEVEEDDEMVALVACNKLTREYKLAKVYIEETFKHVSANCDFFYADMDSLVCNIENALEVLGIIRSKYNKIMIGMKEHDE